MSVSQVSSWLWVSGAPSAVDLQTLATKGVRYTIDCTAECDDVPNLAPGQLVLKKLGWGDDGQPKPVVDFLGIYTRIVYAFNIALQVQPGMLVHCGAGVNRGPMATTFIVAAFDGTPAGDAWKRVVAAHPDARAWDQPNYQSSIKAALTALRGGRE